MMGGKENRVDDDLPCFLVFGIEFLWKIFSYY